MTHVFVYEFTCAAPAASVDAAGASALNAEGEAMLAAVLADFQAIDGVEAFTIRHASDEPTAFRAAARCADWTLVIAPEFDDILLNRCRWVLEEGGRLLGPSPDAVALCADKLELARHWARRGVSTPATVSVLECVWSDYVVKPRFGAGSQHTQRNGPLAERCDLGPMIVQPFIAGRATSVAYLIGPNERLALPPVSQRLSDDGRFHYLGGRVPIDAALARRAMAIADRALDCIPGMSGYVGIDVLLSDDGRDWAIEINPRLTTSYIGLRALAKFNLAEALLAIARGSEPPRMAWHDDIVEFSADGGLRRQ